MLRLKKCKWAGNTKGFTLIEIAVVLVIIGLIIGAAVKGKDLIQSGKQKKFYTNFLKAWELVVISYYDRTGMVLSDGTVNGGTANTTNNNFDYVSGANFGAANGIDAKLSAIGLSIPSSNMPNSGQYSFKGQFSGTRTITMVFQTLGGQNSLRFANMPTDLAVSMDAMIDGKADGTAGNFRLWQNGVWPDASTTPVVNAQYIIDVP